MKNSDRLDWIDELRGFAILIVVLGHCMIGPRMLKGIQGFHMPLFYLISGYLYKGYKWDQIPLKQFVNAKLKKYIVPYIKWGIINLFIAFRNPESRVAGK